MIYETTCTAPVNIAVIKYWGKRNTSLLLPTNSSLSVTLSQDDLHSKTTIRASPDYKQDRLWLNGIEENVTENKRLSNVLIEARRLRRQFEQESRDNGNELPPLSTYSVWICSENNFPTAAGLASSASGYACLVFTLFKLFQIPLSLSQLSQLARIGSGSACRSVFGGFVAWEMGSKDDGSDSLAVQVAPETHWHEMSALILVVNDAKKGVSSTEGMQTTVQTSDLLQHRIHQVVPQRMKQMEQAILSKDFDTFAELTMKDSNSFHAVCLDTFPPIFYMNDISKAIIAIITAYNKLCKAESGSFKAAYTFDAGPNAVIYALEKDIPEILALAQHFFPGFTEIIGNGKSNGNVDKSRMDYLIGALSKFPIFEGGVKKVIRTRVGDGPRVLANGFDGEKSLLNAEGFPKRTVN